LRQLVKEELKKKRGKKTYPGFSAHQKPEEGATQTMKAHQANTVEFDARRKAILAGIEKKHGKRARKKVENHLDEILEKNAGKINAEGKAKLPFRKAVPNRMKFGERIPLVRRAVKMSNEESLILDTMLAFMRGLKLGLFQHEASLSDFEKERFRDWLQLLSVTIPQEWGVHDLIDDLLARLSFVAKSKDNLYRVLAKHAPRRRIYSPSCRQTEIPFNCGFWKLLHTVSIGLAEYKGGLSLIDQGYLKEGARTFAPIQAADVIRNYIESFFPCPYCSSHFVKQYDDCENQNRCIRLADAAYYATDADWKEMAKWMWEFHNSVNIRVLQTRHSANGRGSVPVKDRIAALWPTIESCIQCYDEDGSWNEDAVFLHLETQYWSEPDIEAFSRMLKVEKDMIDPTGSRLTMLLVMVGVVLLFISAKSVSNESIHRLVLTAKNVRTGAGVTQKRRD
jgi:hypothetical protein